MPFVACFDPRFCAHAHARARAQIGSAVATTDADYVVVGAEFGGGGTLLLMRRDEGGTYAVTDTVVASSPTDRLGSSLSVFQSVVVAGAPQNASAPGYAVLYRINTTTHTFGVGTVLVAPPPAIPSGQFGAAVDFYAGVVAVGAPGWTDGGLNSDAGAVFMFALNLTTGGISFVDSPLAPSPAVNQSLGASVVVWGSSVIAGAIGEDQDGFLNAGAAYVRRSGVGARVCVCVGCCL